MTDENFEPIEVVAKSDPVEANSEYTSFDSKVTCWVCFATAEDDQEAEWVQPCQCRGTTKWVHQSCLQRWIDEKQRGNSTATVTCPQCNAEYVLIFPPFGPLVYVLDVADRILYRVCPLATAGIVVGSVYWTAVTYGAVTVMQTMGHKEGLSAMEQADPLVLLIGLPTIPIMLILGRMIRWEDYLLKLWRKYWTRIPGLKILMGCNLTSDKDTSVPERPPPDTPPFYDPVSATRILCGALLLPTMASAVGKVFFNHISYNPQRALIGGFAFIVIKGVFKMYLRQQQYVRQCQRKILNHDKNSFPPNATPPPSTSTSATNH